MKPHEPGVPLAHYIAEHPGVRVLFCCPCGHSVDVAMPAVVARLKQLGAGDERTGIRTLGPMRRQPCPRCGRAEWESRPYFPPGSGRRV